MILQLTTEDRETLLSWKRARNTPQKLVLRAQIVLLAAEGMTNGAIAKQLDCNIHTVRQWRQRMAAYGLAGLEDLPKSGRPVQPDRETTIVSATLKPPKNATHWSAERLAPQVRASASTVLRTWRKHKLKPHQVTTFKYSQDPLLEAKVVDLVGLYLHPPEDAIVLSVDEKSQIQAAGTHATLVAAGH